MQVEFKTETKSILTFSPTEALISATFWDAIPPILMAPSVALLAILVADTENTDHPYNRKLKAKFT